MALRGQAKAGQVKTHMVEAHTELELVTTTEVHPQTNAVHGSASAVVSLVSDEMEGVVCRYGSLWFVVVPRVRVCVLCVFVIEGDAGDGDSADTSDCALMHRILAPDACVALEALSALELRIPTFRTAIFAPVQGFPFDSRKLCHSLGAAAVKKLLEDDTPVGVLEASCRVLIAM